MTLHVSKLNVTGHFYYLITQTDKVFMLFSEGLILTTLDKVLPLVDFSQLPDVWRSVLSLPLPYYLHVFNRTVPSTCAGMKITPKQMSPIYFHGNCNGYKEHNNII